MGWGESRRRDESDDEETFTLPPQTSCAKCKREIVLGSAAQDRFRYEVIEVRELLSGLTRYYHHPCYNQTH